MTPRTGVVVMSYGTPASPADVREYYTHIRRGRPPTEEQLADLQARYEAIGGLSPLRAETEAQRERIAASLGDRFEVVLGYKHASPFIEDAVDAVTEGRPERVVGVVLAPHDSRGSVGEYVERLTEAGTSRGSEVRAVRSWHRLDAWRRFQADAICARLAGMPAATHVVFTAHSLPERVLEGDVYVDELRDSAEGIAALAGLPADRWSMGWQSAGRTPEPWRGPDILDVLTDLAGRGGTDGVLVCPQGFTADHLEVLYDLDIAAAQHAPTLGLAFARTPMVGADATVLDALAGLIRETAA